MRREPQRGLLGGVCAGIADRVGVDPVLVRVAVAVLAVATAGVAGAAYLLAWIAIPADGVEPQRPATAPARPESAGLAAADWRVAAGVGFITLAGLLVMRELGIWWTDAVVWPLILASSGAALLWRQSRAFTESPPAPATAPAPTDTVATERRRPALADLYRGGFGIALVVGAALLFLSANDALGEVRDTALAAIAVVLALALILAPFLWRLGRNLAAERGERIRSQERAELAAHLHDSVLQTLTLMQKRAADPREVAALARRQERELRAWLFDGDAKSPGDSLAAALEAAAAEVEDAHGIAIEVVAVGDRPVDERARALLGATKEALTNAAKFAADAGPIAVFAEMESDRAQVFVRDRGSGFDPAAIPEDRRGVRESIIGRMQRHGGRATVSSTTGGGTEVELVIEDGST